MSEHEIKNQHHSDTGGKATYVIQSYYGQNDEMVYQNKFHICDDQPDNIQNLSCDELKHVLLKHGMWPQYTKRIKNLEKVEQQFWILYEQEIDVVKKSRLLENIANLQSVTANCYAATKEILLSAQKGELSN